MSGRSRGRPWTAVAGIAAIAVIGWTVPDPALANPQIMVKAKDKGYPANNCQYCHVSKVPTKETFKPDDLNGRGAWLVAERDKQKAKNVDPAWLDTYPGGKN